MSETGEMDELSSHRGGFVPVSEMDPELAAQLRSDDPSVRAAAMETVAERYANDE